MNSIASAIIVWLFATQPFSRPDWDLDTNAFLILVEPNSGNAAAGHLALRLKDTVYHFQRAHVDRLTLTREPWKRFLLNYTVDENREVRVAAIPLEVARLRRHFDEIYARQNRLHKVLEDATENAIWLDNSLLGIALPRMPCAGFLKPSTLASEEGSDLLLRLRAKGLGDFLNDRFSALARQLAAIEFSSPTKSLSTDALSLELSHWRELFEERLAIQALSSGWSLEPWACLRLDDAPALSNLESKALVEMRETQVRSILDLLHSKRPDRGRALFLAISRFYAMDRTIKSGIWHLLFAFPDSATVISLTSIRERVSLCSLASKTFAGARITFESTHNRMEIAYNNLEETATKWRNLAGDFGSTAYRHTGRLVPSAGRSFSPPDLRQVADSLRMRQFTIDARKAVTETRAQLNHELPYELFTSNCVTEMNLAISFVHPLAAVKDPLGFIPSVYFDRVTQELENDRFEVYPSWRQRLLELEKGHFVLDRSPFLSTRFERNSEDGAYLFFTDDVIWTRPALGALNVAYGVLEIGLGAVSAIFDSGKKLNAALIGTLYSLPELVALNIRKPRPTLAPER